MLKSRLGLFKICLICISTVLTAFMLKTLLPFWSSFPFGDHWESVRMYSKFDQEGFQFSEIWKQHNEHRIIPSKLLFTVDYYFFSGRQTFLYVCNYALSLTVFLLLTKHLNRSYLMTEFRAGAEIDDSKNRKTVDLMLWFSVSAFLAWHSAQALNLNWAFQSQFFLAPLFLLIALSFALHRPPSWKTILWLSLFSFCGMISMSNGLITPLILLLAMWSLKYRSVYLLGFLVAAASFYLLYFLGYEFRSAVPDSETKTGIFDVFGFLVGFLTSISLSIDASWPLRYAIVFISVIPLIVVLIRIMSKRPVPHYVFIATFCALFCGLSAGMTAVGRASIGQDAALTYRYLTISFIYWTSVILVGVYFLSTFKSLQKLTQTRSVQTYAILTCFGILSLVLAQSIPRPATALVQNRLNSGNVITEMYNNGILVGDVARRSYPNENVVYRVLPFMDEKNISSFRTEMDHPPEPIRSLKTDDLAECIVGFDDISFEIGQNDNKVVGAKGWFSVNRNGFIPTTFKAISRTGEIIPSHVIFSGLISTSGNVRVRSYSAAKNADDEALQNLSGVFAGAEPGQSCLLKPVPLPNQNIQNAKLDLLEWEPNAASFLTSNQVKIEGLGDAKQGAIFAKAMPDNSGVCSSSSVWGTRVKSDSDIGDIILTLSPETSDKSNQMLLSILTGPSNTNLSISMVYQDESNQRFLLPKSPKMNLFKLSDILDDEKVLQKIILKDEGTGWGTWLGTCGLSQPL